MNYGEFSTRLAQHGRSGHVDVRTFAEVKEGAETYPLLVACSEGRKQLLITAGFHGDETAGPLTLATHLPDIIAYARQRGVGLRIYPCLNPSGFSDGTRYNRTGEQPNNDFLRYEVTPGAWTDELKDGQNFLRYELFRDGPKETRALRIELETMPTPDAALDIHQDPWMNRPLCYAYTFGDRTPYLELVESTAGRLPVARNTEVDESVHTDADGLIELHDGSVTDYLFRRGVPFTAALETSTVAPMPNCHEVNLLWIFGFIDLAAAA